VNSSKSVSTIGIFIGLVSLHYGTGFILGTGEQTYHYGASGAVYALAASFGLLGISTLARFYWREQKPIWDLLGNQYGEVIRHLTNFLSWIWMIGVMAGQMVGAGYAVSVLGMPPIPAIAVIAVLVAILGPLPLKRVAWIFALLLIISTLALIIGLEQLGGFLTYWNSIHAFIPSVLSASPWQVLGIFVTTFLLTLIGMDFHQVLVNGQTDLSAVRGSLLAGFALIPVAFLPTSVVLGALDANILTQGINGKDAIPSILSIIGNKMLPNGGLILVIGLVLVAINSGSGLNRAMIQSIQETPFIPKTYRQSAVLASWMNSIIAFGFALTGLAIVHLMVSFYAIYVAGVFIPFMAYLLDRKKSIRFSANAIRWAAWVGSGSAALVLLIGLLIGADAPDTWMILIGMPLSALVLLTSNDKFSIGSMTNGA